MNFDCRCIIFSIQAVKIVGIPCRDSTDWEFAKRHSLAFVDVFDAESGHVVNSDKVDRR